MDEAERYLRHNSGFCIFPIVDPVTGKAKSLCNAMTYKKNGVHQRFCEKHERMVREIIRDKKNARKHRALMAGVKN